MNMWKNWDKHRRINMLIICAILIFVIGCGSSLYLSAYEVDSTNYDICSPKIAQPIQIVQLTDLHNRTFGKNNQTLISMAEAQSPDLILITGDQLNLDEEDTSVSVETVVALCEIAPVYFSLGNHEVEYEKNFGTDVKALFESAGATVLEREYIDLQINGQNIRIGGIYGYCLPEKYFETGEADAEECAWLNEFQNTDAYTILMCHMPVSWLINDGLDEWNIDCVFSGHTHGGQVIIPCVGGLYGPDLGWFPGYLQGLYYSKDGSKTLVLSRGLGTTGMIPRFNNVPELVVVDIVPEQ